MVFVLVAAVVSRLFGSGLFVYIFPTWPMGYLVAPTLNGPPKLEYAKPPTEPTGARETTDRTGRERCSGTTGPLFPGDRYAR